MAQDSLDHFDFIVIGSGFGGSVAALRLIEKGYTVAVLEKGKWHRTENFPKTNWNLPKFFWLPQLGFYGIQKITPFRHAMVLHGGGVGGGSLVYANQLLVPPDEVFEQTEWGPGDWKKVMTGFYDTAKTMLGANPSPTVGKADQVLREVAMEITTEDTFHKNDVGIFFGDPGKTVPDPYFEGQGPARTGCTFCGACMVGCPVGAKNTLDKNYLHLAQMKGVKIFAETEVMGVQPLTNGQDGYEILTRQSTGFLHLKHNFTARQVVFSGGVLGTVPLLMKCKQKGMLPNISDRLGHKVRTNSEAILAVECWDKSTNWNDQIAITSGVYPDKDTHVEVVRYNKGSDAMGTLTTLLTDGGGRVPRILRFLGLVLLHPIKFLKSCWVPGWASRISGILVMQTVENYFNLTYKRRWWQFGRHSMGTQTPKGMSKPPSYIPIANEITRKMAEKMGGEPRSTLSEVLLDAPLTAHILGGCVMGENAREGVVDFNGEMFGHPGLYVADGSNVPANLGVNPSLTITALSELIMSKMPAKEERGSTQPAAAASEGPPAST